MHNSFIFRLYSSKLFFLLNLELNFSLYGLLCTAKLLDLLIAQRVIVDARFLFVGQVVLHGLQQPVLEIYVELVFKRVPPVIFLGQIAHRFFEVVLEEALGDIQALELAHCLHLLLALHPGVLKSLVLDFDAGDLSLHFLLPDHIFDLLSL